VPILQFIEPRLKKISIQVVPPQQPVLFVDLGLGRQIPLALAGDGMHRLVTILLAIIDNADGIVFLDEIETGIHHSAMLQVWNSIFALSARMNTQIFASTHSWETIKSAYQVAASTGPEFFRLFRLEHDRQKNIVARVYEERALAAAVESGIEVR
jgi:AAA15 family ATPase/GTPase